MPNKTSPTAASPAPKAADTAVKQLPFAFPLLRKGLGKAGASAQFTDEHDIYQLLAEKEPSGSYLVSSKGMWHGGIHVTEAGAGQALDLDSGVRCIADGHVVAYRVNRTYPVSEIPAQNGQPAISAPYSTGFALVRHAMEFPKGTTLTFFSLYMHLQAYEDYESDKKRSKPGYWSTQAKVTEHARDVPDPGKNGQTAPSTQQGLRVRASHPHGRIIGILPQGASVSVGRREKGWGQLTDLHGSSLHASTAGDYVEPRTALDGWIFLGNENGGPVVREGMADSSFDRVVVLPKSSEIPIKAGELIGHLGRYDSLNQASSGNRMVHIEVFCDDSIKSFLDQGRAWIKDHGAHPEDWAPLGLSSDPTILRIDRQTKLYKAPHQEGADAPKTDVIQVYALGELARHKPNQHTESEADSSGHKTSWWNVASANALGHPIQGWVREQNFAGGRVTREFAQKWVDFLPLEGAHDPAHTMFATTKAYVDYSMQADVPNPGSLDKLSALMASVYRALFTTGDGSRAADDLCHAAQGDRGQYPWVMQRMSRLIVKHDSEWANPDKWKLLIAALEKQTGPRPQHAEEQKRIEKLVWWDEVKAGVAGFPAPDVFHIHPIGLVGNFQGGFRFTLVMMQRLFPQANSHALQELVDELNSHISFYKLDTPLRRSHFFAQVMQETGLSLSIEEGFIWKASSLISSFSYFRRNPDKARAHGYDRINLIKADETRMSQADYEAIANGAYGGRVELGNGGYDSGDGWRYRGRGIKQLTGRANYRQFTKWHKTHQDEWPEEILDFEDNPDLLTQPKYAARSAAYFWVANNLPTTADKGSTADQVNAITAIVNVHTDSYAARATNFDVIYNRGDFN